MSYFSDGNFHLSSTKKRTILAFVFLFVFFPILPALASESAARGMAPSSKPSVELPVKTEPVKEVQPPPIMNTETPRDTETKSDPKPDPDPPKLETDPDTKSDDDHDGEPSHEDPAVARLTSVNPAALSTNLTPSTIKQLLPTADASTGALTYGYPFTLPPGRADMVPDLRLSYNNQSSQDASFVGHGWSLSVPFIERLNKTGTDGMYASDYFSSSQGGELVPVGSGLYAPKVEDGSFVEYEFLNNVWTVRDKGGVIYTFGATAASRQDNPSDASQVFMWMLSEIRDRNDNFVSFAYDKDAGAMYPSSIVYTGHGSIDGIFEVVFVREARPDPSMSYRTAFGVTTNDRLSLIDVYANGDLVRSYDLEYTSGDNGARSVLASITETGYDDAGVPTTLPPTTIAYQTTAPGWSSDATWEAPVGFAPQNSACNNLGSRVADINGDGLPDVLQSRMDSASNTWQSVYINNGSGWTLDPSWVIPRVFGYTGWCSGDYGSEVVDINGDALADIIHYRILSSSSAFEHEVYLNTGSGWVQDFTWTIPRAFRLDWSDWGTRLADVNGDGLTDFVWSKGNDRGVALNIGSNWVMDPSWSVPIIFTLDSLFARGTEVADVNGDGLADIVESNTGSSGFQQAIYLNTGFGWILDPSWAFPVPLRINNFADYGTRLADMNGDGLLDVLVGYATSNDFFAAYMNTGSGWVSVPDWTPLPSVFAAGGFGSDTGVRLVDVDGNGMMDFVKSLDTGSSLFPLVTNTWLANGERSDRIIEVTSSSGGTTSVEYQTPQEMTDGPTLLNPETPFVFDVVSAIERDNGFGTVSTHEYLYEGGVYDFSAFLDRKFAGFHIRTKTDAEGNQVRDYFHQGNATDAALGELSDHISKASRAYRTEVLNAAGDMVRTVVNSWDRTDLGNGRSFVKLSQTLAFDYDGNATHRDRATAYAYDNTNGNLTQMTEWGEVNGNSNGTFSDIGSDKRTTTISYAWNPTYHILGFPSQEITTDQAGIKLSETKSYYDTLPLSSVNIGNLTKEERWKTGTIYIDVDRTYNAYGFMTQELDPLNHATNYTPDANNLYPALITNALNHTTSFLYDDSSGKPIQTTDPNGMIFQTDYDGLDRVILEKQPNALTPSVLETKTSYSYVPQTVGMRTLKTDYLDASLSRDTYSYTDGFDRPIQTRVEAESSNTFSVSDIVYDTREFIASQSLPYFSTGVARTASTTPPALLSTFTYDALGRTTNLATAVGNTSTGYDQWISTITDPRGVSHEFERDAFDRLVGVVEHNGSSIYTTSYAYNLRGDLTSLTDALGNTRSLTYDGLSRRLTAEDLHAPGDTTFGTWTYVYDDVGNLSSSLDPKNQTIQYGYDNINRQLTENFTGAAGVEVTNVYDSCTNGIGRLCTVTKTNFSESRTYDPLGRTVTQTRTIESTPYVTSFTYDRQDNPLTITNPDFSQVQYLYNSAGLLNAVNRKESTTSWTPVVSSIDYAPTGARTLTAYANGKTTTNTYDASELYRLRTRVTTPGNLQNLTYAYDPNGNVMQIVDASTTLSAKTTMYAYDDLNRLLSATVTGAANGDNGTQSYSYNAIGDFLTHSDVGNYTYAGNTGTNYANPHAATSAGGATFTYDNNGNLATSVTQTTVMTTPAITPPWYAGAPGSWTKRLPLTIQQTQINGTAALANFPVLVSRTLTSLRSTANGGNVAQANGNDILFTASDGITKLDHEIETYNPATGQLIAWVRIPSLSATVNTAIYLYVGNPSASNQQNAAGVWETNYKGVWHLKENPSFAGAVIMDSTSNAYHGTSYGSMPASASTTAKVGQGLTFDGSNDYVDLGTAANVNSLTNNFTVSAWVWPTSLSGTRRFISAARALSNNGFGFGTYGTYPRLTTYGRKSYTRATTLSLNAWAKLDAVMSNNNVLFYRNGVYLGTVTYTQGGIVNPDDALRLGASTITGSASASEFFAGTMDEVRVSGGVRNSYWIQAEYNNQNAPTSFVTFGTIQSIPVPVPITTNVTSTYAWDYANRLTGVTSPTLSASFLYDADGTRVKSVLGGVTTKTPTTWYNLVGTTQTKHILLPDGEMLATVEGSNASASVSYIHTDHLTGSALSTNASGVQTQLLDYHPFGTIRINNQSTTFNEKRKFAGHEYDTETGLSYMQARYYEPATGRFLSEDPAFLDLSESQTFIFKYQRSLEQHLSNPQNLNSYSYGLNNPVTFRDPQGEVVPIIIAAYLVANASWLVPAVMTWTAAATLAISTPLVGGQVVSYINGDSVTGDRLGDANQVVLGAGTAVMGGMMSAGRIIETRAYSQTHGRSGNYIPTVSRNNLSSAVQSSMKGYEQNGWQKRIGLEKKVYRNDEGYLPGGQTYKEFDVNPAIGHTRDAQRFYRGDTDGSVYYTDTHMGSDKGTLVNKIK